MVQSSSMGDHLAADTWFLAGSSGAIAPAHMQLVTTWP